MYFCKVYFTKFIFTRCTFIKYVFASGIFVCLILKDCFLLILYGFIVLIWVFIHYTKFLKKNIKIQSMNNCLNYYFFYNYNLPAWIEKSLLVNFFFSWENFMTKRINDYLSKLHQGISISVKERFMISIVRHFHVGESHLFGCTM